MSAKKQFSAQCITIKLDDVTAYSFPMKVRDLVSIYYVAVRGDDDEEGAVQ